MTFIFPFVIIYYADYGKYPTKEGIIMKKLLIVLLLTGISLIAYADPWGPIFTNIDNEWHAMGQVAPFIAIEDYHSPQFISHFRSLTCQVAVDKVKPIKLHWTITTNNGEKTYYFYKSIVSSHDLNPFPTNIYKMVIETELDKAARKFNNVFIKCFAWR